MARERKVKQESNRTKDIPEKKKKIVLELIKFMKESKAVMLASMRGLPGSQFHKIKKQLRGIAELRVPKRSAIKRAIEGCGIEQMKELENYIQSDVVLLFSEKDPFTLAGLLKQRQSPAKAKAGDIAPEDIKIEAGPTDLLPGPAISELASVGLKVSVENGKLTIKQGAVIVKKGAKVEEKAVGVLGKLNVTPMKVGFIPVAAYDADDKKVYGEITIDSEGTLNSLREAVGKSVGFAIKIGYATKETVKFMIHKAEREAKALNAKVQTTKKEDVA